MIRQFDLLIKDGRIIDGTGNPYYLADIGISDGQLIAIDRGFNPDGAKKVINAAGLTVSPGFIDTHSHDDAYLIFNPRCDEKILQGVTTEVTGNCGSSLAPISKDHREDLRNWSTSAAYLPQDFWEITSFKEYLIKIEAGKPGINVIPLVGHAAIRIAVLGLEERPPSKAELEQMKRLTAEAMEDGAFGLSTGLVYAPACFAQTEEIIELAKIVGQFGGIYSTHMRNEGDRQLEAIDEALRIARAAAARVIISHHKTVSKEPRFSSIETLKMFARARAEGVEITCDQYPYSAASTNLAAGLPHSIQAGGPNVYAEKLRSPDVRRAVIEAIEKGADGSRRSFIKTAGFENIVITTSKNHKDYIGKSLAEIGKTESRNPYDVFFDLVVEEKKGIGVIMFMLDEENIIRIMKNPLTMIGTDGIPGFGAGKVHPRFTGTFPRVLGRYVREQGVLTLEEAVRKMTSLPAQTFRVKRKGLLKEGFDADIVIFDPEKILDKATYQDPAQSPEGIHWVIVNGVIAVEKGQIIQGNSGKVLRYNQGI